MEASAQNKKCNICNKLFENRHSATEADDFIKNAKTDFSQNVDCQQFLNDIKNDPKLIFNTCSTCLIIRKQKWKFSSKTKNLPNVQSKWRQAIFITVIISLIFGPIYLNCNYNITAFGYSLIVDTDLNSENISSMVNDIKDKLPSIEQGLLKKLKSGLSRLKTPGEPFIFLLLHDDANKKTTDCLVSRTSILAKQYIFTNTAKSLWINASDWTSYSDHDNEDLLYEKLIEPLKENNVLVIENLQDLPWSLANDLHFLCDSNNPKIAKAIYILELRVNTNDVGLQQLTEAEKMVAAERGMSTAWTEAPSSYRAALITRLTSYVDLIKFDDECSDPAYNFPEIEKLFIRISPDTDV